VNNVFLWCAFAMLTLYTLANAHTAFIQENVKMRWVDAVLFFGTSFGVFGVGAALGLWG